MKYCTYPHEYLLVDHFDGTVWTCPWMVREDGIIGNILKTPVEEVWHSEKAQTLRNKLSHGDFSSCRSIACPYIQNNSLKETAEEEVRIPTPEMPKFINLAHDYICNLSCETCRASKFTALDGYGERIRKMNERLAPYLNRAETISLSGHGDPFASPYMLRLMHEMMPKSQALRIDIETNGVLFTPANWKRIEHLAECNLNVIITVNSFDKFTYEHISRGGDYEALMRNLDFISGLRTAGKIRSLQFAMVMQDRNFRQIPDFIKKAVSGYACDRVVLRPVYQWGTMPEQVYWFKDVLNPMHPYHPEYLEIMDDPMLKHEKVFNFGGGKLHPTRPYPHESA